MKALRLVLPVAGALLTFMATSAFATKEMQKKEKKPCTTCHTSTKEATKEKPMLNNVGKYYSEKKTLEGAPAPTK
ncbi:MAG: hypothetical protein HY821_04620 [Acidobacteria bacterium]|nr:hypothetical protein [Acidobacteriota bacterium]